MQRNPDPSVGSCGFAAASKFGVSFWNEGFWLGFAHRIQVLFVLTACEKACNRTGLQLVAPYCDTSVAAVPKACKPWKQRWRRIGAVL